jgi:hypothetical protein
MEHVNQLTSGDYPKCTIELNAPTNELLQGIESSSSAMVVHKEINWPQIVLR